MKKRVKEILLELDKLTSELFNIREKCKHKKSTFTYDFNTGNYDPSADCYWKDHKCSDCGKPWREHLY